MAIDNRGPLHGLGWKAQIKIKEYLDQYDEANDNVRQVAGNVLRELNAYTLMASIGLDMPGKINELDSIIDELQVVTDVDEMDDCLEHLYDWGDTYRVLIN